MTQSEVQWTLYQQRLAGIKLSAARYRGPSEHDECVRDIKFLLDEIGRLTHMMELKQVTPAGQRWTRTKPTEPGWYWWRNNGDPEMVHVIEPSIVLLCGDNRICSVNAMIGHGTGEWQGPLTPNEATE